MNVIEIKPNGFCNGVIRAIKMVDDLLLDNNTLKPIYMFGELVHNKFVTEKYKDRVITISSDFDNELDKITKGTIIFTAHGIKPSLKDKAINKGWKVVDTTCPNVIKIQNLIKEKLNEGYDVLVVGKSTHPEVLSYLGISDKIKLFSEGLIPTNKTFIVNQTTLIYDDVLKIYEKLKSTYVNVEIALEICNATKVRQCALNEYKDKCDAFIIVGDKMSNNCTSLYEVASKIHPSFKIEHKDDLKSIDLSGFKMVGVTAGASTPRWILDEIIEELEKRP